MFKALFRIILLLINAESITLEQLEEAVNSIRERAEEGPEYSQIFVDTNVLNILKNNKHQVIYGRRGTGKTHLLGRLVDFYKLSFEEHKILPIYVDGRVISEGIIPSEANPGISLLISYRRFIESLLTEIEKFTDDNIILNLFEKLGGGKKERLTNVREVVRNIRKIIRHGEVELGIGKAESELVESKAVNKKTGLSFDAQLQSKLELPSANLGLALSRVSTKNVDDSLKIIYEGLTILNFQKIGQYLDRIIEELELSSIGILFDEWSGGIDTEIQPFLAYMIKTTLVSGRSVFIKFACVPFFTRLSVQKGSGQSIGFARHEDIFVDVNLDQIYNAYIDTQNVATFLLQVLQKHLGNKIKPLLDAEFLEGLEYFNEKIFEKDETITELAISSAGVPRDFLRIFVKAFNKSKKNLPISTKNVREATHEFFQEEKRTLLEDNQEAKQLFERTYNEICLPAHTTIFFVSSDLESRLLEYIWHHRLIHIVPRGHSAFASGKLGTYDVYAIDHGRYIQLTSMKKGEEMYNMIEGITAEILKSLNLPSQLSKIWTLARTPLKNKFSINYASKVEIDSKIGKLSENCKKLIADKLVVATLHQK